MKADAKDVIIALFGAGVGLAGLLLVFEGFIIAAYSTLPKVTPEENRRPLRRAAWAAFGSLTLCIISIVVSLVWLLTQQWFQLAILTFAASLCALFCLGFYVNRELTR